MMLKKQLKKITSKVRIELAAQYWKKLNSGKMPDVDGQTILIWRGPGGITASLNIEMLFANAFRERGAKVIFFVCDGSSLGCVMRTLAKDPKVENWSERCPRCRENATRVFEASGFEYHTTTEYITDADRKELRQLAETYPLDDLLHYKYEDVEVGLFAEAATIRFLKGMDISRADPYFQQLLREYFFTALINTVAAKQVEQMFQPDKIFFQHGIYVDWGPFYRVMIDAGIPTTVWMRGYLRNHFYLRTDTKDDEYHMYFPQNNEIEKRLNTPLTKAQKTELAAYLKDRETGANLTVKLFTTTPEEKEKVRQQLGFKNDKPIWALFTHLNWDAQFSFEAMVYPDTTTWALETVKMMIENDDVNWLVKVHPAELSLGTSKGAYQAIMEKFPNLPDHIKVLPPNTPLNTYGILPLIAGGLTISGTIGMELALKGKPAILAGVAHYGERGFTYDHNEIVPYQNTIKNIAAIPLLTEEQRLRAERYCHWFFIRRQLHLDLIAENGAKVKVDSIEELQKGKHAVLDLICERVLHGGGEFELNP